MDTLKNAWSYIVANLGSFIEFVIIFVVIIILHYAIKIIYKRMHPKLSISKRIWDDALLRAVYQPLRYIVWLNGIALIINLIGQSLEHDSPLFSPIEPIRKIGTIVFVVWIVNRFIQEMEKNWGSIAKKTKQKLDKTTLRAISQLLRLAVAITSGLSILQTLGISVAGVVAFGGISGIAIGFAAKDLLANFFGGLMIFFDRPFAIGDWIRSPDRDIEGTVEYIGWRLTRIRTFDKRPLYIPNALFSTISIENPSRMQNRRIKTQVTLRYKDAHKVEKVVADVQEMLLNHPEIDTTKTCFVNLVEFAPSGLEFLIYTFTKTTDWVKFQAIQQDVFYQVLKIIERNGAECSFPTTTLNLPQELKVKQT
ncbi:MAG: mechanosensitive ion channel family protein [Rhabdochlamydiaceae bacterium]|nr:mechanosensitive ion channel family protein [Candidatus Amphrikana amoebophyrae]